jgi:hypothetical protein
VADHTPAALAMITGVDCPGASECFRDDGSGWVIVPVVDGMTGGHCWFMNGGCLGDLTPAAAFVAPRVDVPYTLAANADWLRAMVSRQ